MSLQGTLETFAVPDVLSLLAATKKTGALQVDGGRSRGRLWLDAGQVVGADVARAATLADAVFELLRLTGGSFSFDGEGRAPRPADPVAVETLLAEAQARLGEWRAIEAVVPSVACPVRLAPALPGEEVTVSAAQWKALVAAVAGGDVEGVMSRLEVGEFEACRTVKELVDAGLVQVEPAPAAPAPAAASPAAPAPAPAPRGDRSAGRTPTPPARPAPGGDAEAPPAPPAPAARPAPVAARRPAPGPRLAPPARPVPASAVTPAPAAPGPAGRRPGMSPSSLEEAEELVHQLASLRSAPPRPEPAERPAVDAERTGTAPTTGDDTDEAKAADKDATKAGDDAVDETMEGDGEAAPAAASGRSDEEPINRGMLLKFLSSVRS